MNRRGFLARLGLTAFCLPTLPDILAKAAPALVTSLRTITGYDPIPNTITIEWVMPPDAIGVRVYRAGPYVSASSRLAPFEVGESRVLLLEGPVIQNDDFYIGRMFPIEDIAR